MTDIEAAAREITSVMITAARASATPVEWVTGNQYMPPLRSFAAAERVWQSEANNDGSAFETLAERVESALNDAEVYLGCPDYDNSLYVVDMRRWQARDETDDAGETLNDEWEPRADA